LRIVAAAAALPTRIPLSFGTAVPADRELPAARIRCCPMDGLLEFLLGMGGIAVAAFLLVLLLGTYFLWRSSRKLNETT
jgi:hypothetical protein